jgi:ABC-2 type transport system ATP-binding protein
LLDEPASGLDPRARVEMRELIQELRRMGKTILVSSHILPELEELCTWVGFIDRGRMVAVGPMSDVRDRVAAGRRLRIDLVEPEGDSLVHASDVAKNQKGVVDVQIVDDHEEMVVSDSFEDHELLALLVRNGLKVRSFGVIEGDLSEAFMRLTGGQGGG